MKLCLKKWIKKAKKLNYAAFAVLRDITMIIIDYVLLAKNVQINDVLNTIKKYRKKNRKI